MFGEESELQVPEMPRQDRDATVTCGVSTLYHWVIPTE